MLNIVLSNNYHNQCDDNPEHATSTTYNSGSTSSSATKTSASSALTTITPVHHTQASVNLHVFKTVFSVTLMWVLLGVVFYAYYEDWSFTTAFFYAMQSGLSVGFGNLVERQNSVSLLFTTTYGVYLRL